MCKVINNVKRILAVSAVVTIPFMCYGGPKTRDYADPYTSNGPIKGGELLTGLLLIAIGILIIYLLSRIKTENDNSSLGCVVTVIGLILIGIGLLFLAPLFDFLGALFYLITILVAIPVIIYSLFKRDK